MVTKVTRDVLDLKVRAIIPGEGGLVVEGNSGVDFQISGTVIGSGAGGAADGTFVNVTATNVNTTNLTVDDVLDASTADGTFADLTTTDLTVDDTIDTTNLTVDGGTLDASTATLVGFGGLTPIGGVIMFNAAFAAIPSNWQLCDGSNGTPDMHKQFVYGTTTEGQLLDSGGSADAVNVDHGHSINDPSHKHNLSGGGSDDDGGSNVPGSDSTGNVSGIQFATTGISVNDSGVSGNNKNLPPYIKLAFIQRMS